MSDAFETLIISADEADGRLDRALKRAVPGLKQGELEKALRKKFVRLNGARACADKRVGEGDKVTYPKFLVPASESLKIEKSGGGSVQSDKAEIKSLTLFENEDFLILNKPSGLAVQGGSGTVKHLDGMLEALRVKKNFRPSLTHRLDKDTSGCLLVAKKRAFAVRAGEIFRRRLTEKYYLAVIDGEAPHSCGVTDAPLTKLVGPRGAEKVRIVKPTEEGAQKALTYYHVIERIGSLSLILLRPFTGRTHQLRVHVTDFGPNAAIVGDGKYGYSGPRLPLHLHAYCLRFPQSLQTPEAAERLEYIAPLPEHMLKTLSQKGTGFSRATFHAACETMTAFVQKDLKKRDVSLY